MSDYMPRKCLSAPPRMPEAERIAALEAQLLAVCQREAEMITRYDAQVAALEAEIADLRALAPEPAWTPPAGFFRLGGDARLRQCASDGCFQHVSYRVEFGGIGSEHCQPCAQKIAEQAELDGLRARLALHDAIAEIEEGAE